MSKVTLTKLMRRFDPEVTRRGVLLHERPEVLEPLPKQLGTCLACGLILTVPDGTVQKYHAECRKVRKKYAKED